LRENIGSRDFQRGLRFPACPLIHPPFAAARAMSRAVREAHATHAGSLNGTTMNAHIHYRGYEVAPAAQRLPNGLFAANLTIEKADASRAQAYSFDALDYFFDEEHALAYAFRWARMWVDHHQ
jgi:hypothetical protein